MGLVCFGANSRGQLGDGTRSDRSLPTAVAVIDEPIDRLWVGEEFACTRLSSSSETFCWGANDQRQLGDGTTDDHLVPTATGL